MESKSLAICIEPSVGKTDLENMTKIVKPDLLLINQENTNENLSKFKTKLI